MRRSGAPDHIGVLVALKDRQNALKNPKAHLHEEGITFESVSDSMMLWDPLRYSETCPSSDGACAMVLTDEAGGDAATDPAWMLGTEVNGKTLGIVGFGRIGQAVARRATGFAMRVLYSTPRELIFNGAEHRTLDALLAESDVVSLHVPLVPATRNLIDRQRIQSMKPGAILVNTARGGVVDEVALAEALSSGHLGGAGLDVFEDEPHVRDALLRLENVVLTPHLGSGTRETRAAMSRMVLDEIERVARGGAPLHRVV